MNSPKKVRRSSDGEAQPSNGEDVNSREEIQKQIQKFDEESSRRLSERKEIKEPDEAIFDLAAGIRKLQTEDDESITNFLQALREESLRRRRRKSFLDNAKTWLKEASRQTLVTAALVSGAGVATLGNVGLYKLRTEFAPWLDNKVVTMASQFAGQALSPTRI